MTLSRILIRTSALCLFCLAASALLPVTLYAQDENQEDGDPVRVAIKTIEPFVFIDQDRITGFSIDLWEEVILITGLPFEFVVVETVQEQLQAVSNGQADVAIAAISMTPEREELIDFSYPYFRGGLQIMTIERPESVFNRLFGFIFSSRFLWGLAGFMLILIAVGHVIWFVEHRTNPDFPRSYWRGIWEGLWWAAVTVTTVGYGDKRVKDHWGRILAIFWMFAGLFLIANFTAFVTSEATISRLQASINDIDDLRGKRVATVAETTSAEFLRSQGISFRTVETIDDAYSLLENNLADALVYDAPVLQYYLTTRNDHDFLLVGSPFKLDDYGIAMVSGSIYEESINQALLEIRVNGTYEELAQKWGLEAE